MFLSFQVDVGSIANWKDKTMAETIEREILEESDPDCVPDDPRKAISVLLLATRWTLDTYGLSMVNKSMVNNLRLVDPGARTIRITCAVLEEEEKISEDQIKDAENHKVELVGYRHPRGPRKSPNIEWLNQTICSYYNHVANKQKYDLIIGHAPYLAHGCFTLKDVYVMRGHQSKVILMVHSLPRAEEQVDSDMLYEWLEQVDVVFSVGKTVQSELKPYIHSLNQDKKPVHSLYVPGFAVELLGIEREPRGSTVQGTQYVSMMTGEPKNPDIPGLDFPLAVSACVKASEHIRLTDNERIKLELLAVKEEDKIEWRSWFNEQNIHTSGLSFECPAAENFDRVKRQLKRSNLFIQPLVSDSILFGVEALSAAAAGVPILVSRNSGVSAVLESLIQHEMIVRQTSNMPFVDAWKEAILQKILRPEESQRKASELRKQLLLDRSITKTHLDLINIIAGKFQSQSSESKI